jgi:transposase
MRRRLDLFPTHGQPACAPWRLALVTVFQFMENLTDRQAADAVRDRLAWKYALSLELTDTGFDHTVLSEFRSRLVEGNAEQRLLDLLLERCREGGWRKRPRKATHRLHPRSGQGPCTQPHLVRGSDDGLRVERALGGSARLGSRPRASRVGRALWGTARTRTFAESEEQERIAYANQVGADGWMLLAALEASATPDWMKTLPAISTLRTMWEQQFEPREQGGQWRAEPAFPAAQLISSPYDLEARNGKKRS